MSDLFQGQTMTYAATYISAGAAHTFKFPFQPDMAKINNLTDWTSTAGGLPEAFWFRNLTAAGYAHQKQCIDTNAGSSFNYIDLATNGFTVADTDGGVGTRHTTITGVSEADPCVVSHAAYTFQNDQIVRFTDLGNDMPTERGMEQINNKRYKITVINGTSFSLQDVITGEDIDSTTYTTWVAGGRITLETNVLRLNNPEVGDYAVTPYTPNAFAYDPIDYKLTLGTNIIGANDKVMLLEAFKWGEYVNLGDLA